MVSVVTTDTFWRMLETCPWFRCSSTQQFLTGAGITF